MASITGEQTRIHVVINISYDDFLPFYEGRVKDIIAPSLAGKSIRFPAKAIRPYLTRSGIRGIFELCMNPENKLLSCERVGNIKGKPG